VPKPSDVDEYLAGFAQPARSRLEEIRAICRAAAPAAEERIKWNQPTYVHASGVILVMFSGHKAHANVVFTPSTRETFAEELTAFRTGKGSVALPYDQPVPTDVLRRMIHHRIREHEDDGVLWM